MRDRERNKQALILQEKFRASQELSRKLNRERFQRNQHIRNLNFEARSLRYQLLLKDLESEKSHWIRRDNMTSKITDELFEEPCTTGLISKTSYYWRYHPISIKLNRKMSEEYYKMFVAADGLSDSKSSQNALAKKLMVEDFLEPLVSTGKERQSYKELVKEFSEKFQNLHAFEGYEWYFDVSTIN